MIIKDSSKYILVLLTGFLINMWIENGSNNFYENYIQTPLNYPIKIPVVILILLIAFAISVFFNYRNSKNTEIQVLNEQIKDGSRALWKYFKDIGEVKTKEIIEEVMDEFIKKNTNVLSVQLYEYSIKNLKDKSIIYVEHKYSRVTHSIDLNALIQSSYTLPQEIYDDYIQLRIAFESGYLTPTLINRSMDFYIQITSEILQKNLDDLDEQDAIKYIYCEIIFDLIAYYLQDENLDSIETLDNERYLKLHQIKRTGILKGIEMGQPYTFEHNGMTSKNGRKYISKTISNSNYLNKGKYLILISLSPKSEHLSLEDYRENLYNLINQFEISLETALQSQYSENLT